jgi:invasion protein IalB
LRALKGAGTILAVIVGFVALIFFAALFSTGHEWVSKIVREYLDIAAIIALAVCGFILLPCALFRATRTFSAYGVFISSVIFGAFTWIFGFLVTLQYWGVFGVLIGLSVVGVGVVPLGILAAAFDSNWSAVGRLALGLVFTFGAGISVPVIIAQPQIVQPPTPVRSGNWVMWVSAGVFAFIAVGFLLNYNSEVVENGGVPTVLENNGVAKLPENGGAATLRKIASGKDKPTQTQSQPQTPTQPQAPAQQPAPSQPLAVGQPQEPVPSQMQLAWQQYATVRPTPAPGQPQLIYSQLIYSPWIKGCSNGPDTNNKRACIITKDSRLENGKPVAVVQLFEQEGKRRALRITLPLGVQVQPGTRLIIDQTPPSQQPFVFCFPAGCMSDYPVTDDVLDEMKKGKMLWVQAINMKGTPISIPLPLTDFAKAYDGHATNSRAFQDQQGGPSH